MSYVKSFKILTCNENKDHMLLSLLIYFYPACTGVGIPYASVSDIPVGCQAGMRFSCDSNPHSLKEKWPAVDIYFDDNKCDKSYLSLAFNPGCYHGGEGFGLKCSADKKFLSFRMFDDRSACTDDQASYISVPTDICLSTRIQLYLNENNGLNVLNTMRAVGANMEAFKKELRGTAKSNHDDGSMYFEGYYVARCNGYLT